MTTLRSSQPIRFQSPAARSSLGPDAFLRANSDAYEWAVARASKVDSSQQPELAAQRVAAAAGFAAEFHPGRFADGAIENIALRVGQELGDKVVHQFDQTLQLTSTASRRRVLHVATHMVSIGGHSRMLNHWIRSDRSSTHSLVLTEQRERPIPPWLTQTVALGGGSIVTLPSTAGIIEKASWLRQAARTYADVVVLHHDGHDVVPTVAFHSDGGPPVVVLNHADHQFWLGSSIADGVINLRLKGSTHTASRRFVQNNVVLPVPLALPAVDMTRENARTALGIPKDQIMLLSVGRSVKYRPCGEFDFVATAGRILDMVPKAHLHVVGATAEQMRPYLRVQPHERLHFVGSIEDPTLYRAAADIYVESFPFGSQTALLESALMGLPVVTAYAPLFELLVTQDDAISDLITTPSSQDAYIEQAVALAASSEARRAFGSMLRNRLLEAHVGNGWRSHLSAVYGVLDALEHAPGPIPSSARDQSHADIGLSYWHIASNGRDYDAPMPQNQELALRCHSAYISRVIGDFSAAKHHAWRAVLAQPTSSAAWRLVGVTHLGRHAGRMRNMLGGL